MNQPNIQELPTRDEVIALAEGQEMLAYTEDGKRALPANDNRLRCAICDAPAGEVTLVKVKAQSAKAKTVAFLSHQPNEAYVCQGGDCAGQRNLAIARLFRRAAGSLSANRYTKPGHAMQWQLDSDGRPVQVYARTGRSHKQAKARRGIQKQSRRANRG